MIREAINGLRQAHTTHRAAIAIWAKVLQGPG